MDENTVLALFDPIYDLPGLSAESDQPSNTPVLKHAHEAVIVEQISVPDSQNANNASVSTPVAQLPPSSAVQESNASTTQKFDKSSENKKIGVFHLSSKPFIPREQSLSQQSGPSYPSARTILRGPPVHRVRFVAPENRSASLPILAPRSIIHEYPLSFSPTPSNRTVSLPDGALTPRSRAVETITSNLGTVDETGPLIDFSSPRLQAPVHLPPVPSSPNGSMIIHSSFSRSSEGPSPPSSPDITTEDDSIIIGHQIVSARFFGREEPEITPGSLNEPKKHEEPDAFKPTSWGAQDVKGSFRPYGLESVPDLMFLLVLDPAALSVPKPIPALHGPSSLPYARCPS